ncbi:GIY-YIG nuclease family protein [Mollicutes bacterium LVI A0039]|nr:GIY-YIG nuclease family protein [Mollicutes bacterium LVI A0039]
MEVNDKVKSFGKIKCVLSDDYNKLSNNKNCEFRVIDKNNILLENYEKYKQSYVYVIRKESNDSIYYIGETEDGLDRLRKHFWSPGKIRPSVMSKQEFCKDYYINIIPLGKDFDHYDRLALEGNLYNTFRLMYPQITSFRESGKK